MATFAQTASKIFYGQFDLSGDVRSQELTVTRKQLDATTFTSGGWEAAYPGLAAVAVKLDGLSSLGAGEVEETAYTTLGSGSYPLTLDGSDGAGAEGDTVYFMKDVPVDLALPAQVGEMAAFSTNYVGNSTLARGKLLAAKATRLSSANGTASQLGAVSATQKLYAVLHVFSASVPTSLVVKVQSDNAEGFPSATDRITFTTATGATSEWATPVAGAITDDWWRVTWTIVGTSFTFAAAVGIV